MNIWQKVRVPQQLELKILLEIQTHLFSKLKKCMIHNLNAQITILLYSRCCMCGIMMVPNASNTCLDCLKSQIDITEGIPKSLVLNHCRQCLRYLRPPWTSCELESPELLALCLKNMRGLKRVKLIDAGFVWTEPHSQRLKVKITIQKEVANNTLLQQNFIVEFVIEN